LDAGPDGGLKLLLIGLCGHIDLPESIYLRGGVHLR
jgi:hypothetical protein